MNFKLYEKQQTIADEIQDIFNNTNNRANGQFYLSGEMGSGKTYMGAYIANINKNEYNVFVVSPKININKWSSLLDDAHTIHKKEVYDPSNKISIIAFEDLNVWLKSQKPFKQPMFIIVDEVHLAVNSKKDAFDTLISFTSNQDMRGLYLTGTIMEGEKREIVSIMRTTHPHLVSNSLVKDMKEHFETFIFRVWQHVSTSVSLEDIQDLMENRQEIKQEIAPIHPIPLTTEQMLFSDVISSQFSDLDVSKQTSRTQIASYLDNPEKNLDYRMQTRTSKSKMKSPKHVTLAMPLKDIAFQNTSKYQKLVELIKNSNDDRILVYVNEETIIQKLKASLKDDGINAFTIEHVDVEMYSDYINQQFKTTKVGIVDPSKVNVGIDIHAEQLVWYQLMPKLDKMIQAQRRVCRLSSENKSLVTIMVYDTDYENQRAEELSNATKQNALTYGVKQQDNLAQLTGILLEGVD